MLDMCPMWTFVQKLIVVRLKKIFNLKKNLDRKILFRYILNKCPS